MKILEVPILMDCSKKIDAIISANIATIMFLIWLIAYMGNEI